MVTAIALSLYSFNVSPQVTPQQRVVDTIRHLDVCAGIGGFSLGLRLADERVRTIGYVELDAFCSAVLMARMEDKVLESAPVWCAPLEDLRGSALDGLRNEVDLLSAGFPCQPWSQAGKRMGIRDKRWIWPEIARLIADVGARAVFLENVSLAALRGARRDLARLGFACRPPVRIAAADVGAPHRRRRWFLFSMAYTIGGRYRRIPYVAGPSKERGGLANCDSAGRRIVGQQITECKNASRDEPCGRGMSWLTEWPPGRNGDWREIPEEAQPGFPGMANGVPDRLDRVRALGNAVVPQVVAVAWRHFTGYR